MKFQAKCFKHFIFGMFSLFSPFLFPSPVQNTGGCLSNFQEKENHPKQEEKQLSLFDSPSLTEPPKDFKLQPQITPVKKEDIVKDFLQTFEKRDFQQIKSMVNKFPFLKDVRFNIFLINHLVEEKHLNWCPNGWSPLQLASYAKDIQMLEWFLELGFNIRIKKTIRGVSLEHNPLHIAIKRDFKEGAEQILAYAHDNIPLKQKKHFIDEKNQYTETPWGLAVRQDQKKPLPVFILIVGQYGPSGYVESYDWNGLKDGYEIAEETGNSILVRLAKFYLVAPNYRKHKKNKLKRGHRTKTPSYH